MQQPGLKPTPKDVAMLDEDALVAVLSRHFPGAARTAVRQAAEDVLLLELLTRDLGVVWEDAMREPPADGDIVVFDGRRPRDS